MVFYTMVSTLRPLVLLAARLLTLLAPACSISSPESFPGLRILMVLTDRRRPE